VKAIPIIGLLVIAAFSLFQGTLNLNAEHLGKALLFYGLACAAVYGAAH
jgi:hypothetical protein